MATASRVQLSGDLTPAYYRPGVSQAQSSKASELLQDNHDNHHIFFNDSGFHDHIVHHLLTLWALNAPTEDIKNAYGANQSYQRSINSPEAKVKPDLHDDKAFQKALGKAENWKSFLLFFQGEIEKSNWERVVYDYLLANNERANDMLARMYGGLYHPLIHLGFGIEFKQPAIIAEALSQAALHKNNLGNFLLSAEKAANENRSQQSKTIAELLDEMHNDSELRKASHLSGGPSVFAVVQQAGKHLLKYASQYHVNPENLEEETAAMINATCYFTAGAQRRDRRILFDFYSIHAANCSVFFSAFLKQDWLSTETKVRLLEWKVRTDLATYAAVQLPDLHWDEVENYEPKHPEMGWEGIEDRACKYIDDGHTAKLVRALANGQIACQPFDKADQFRVKQDDWLKIAHMVMDSNEITMASTHEMQTWVRGAGYDEAWSDIPSRSHL